MAEIGWNMPYRALLLLLGGIAAAAILALLLVYPAHSKIDQAKNRLQQVKAQVEAREILGPVFVRLQAAQTRLPEQGPYPMPASDPLDMDMDQLSLMLLKKTQEHGLTTLNISPAMDDLAGIPRRLVLSMEMRGPLADFHAFLLDLLEQPYLDEVRSLTVREAGAHREYQLKFGLHYR